MVFPTIPEERSLAREVLLPCFWLGKVESQPILACEEILRSFEDPSVVPEILLSNLRSEEDAVAVKIEPRDVSVSCTPAITARCSVKARHGNFKVKMPALVRPKSCYQGWTSELPRVMEGVALENFLLSAEGKANASFGSDSYRNIKLEQFCIYEPYGSKHSLEFVPLQLLALSSTDANFLIDGVLQIGDERIFISGAPFSILSIGGYGDVTRHSLINEIWIQSHRSQQVGVWYQLGQPAPEYERLYSPFVWLAHFSKHFMNFLACHEHPLNVDCERFEHERVFLHHFREKFYDNVTRLYKDDKDFDRWLKQYPSIDFRRVVANNVQFLWNTAFNNDPKEFARHPVWKETYPTTDYLTAVKEQPVDPGLMTVVTPLVYSCFRGLPWSKFLKVKVPLQLSSDEPPMVTPKGRQFITSSEETEIKVGDVVCIGKDEKTIWREEAHVWYAYVQGSIQDAQDQKLLSVIWLYEPSDTPCSRMEYPFKKELFFSDNCNCADAALDAKDVLRKVKVDFYEQPNESQGEFFVRQKFRTEDSAFVTLRDIDLVCEHQNLEKAKAACEAASRAWEGGDTVLIKDRRGGRSILEPVIVQESDYDLDHHCVLVRRLARRSRDYPGEKDRPPNELVLTLEHEVVDVKRIVQRCDINYLTHQEHYSEATPYSMGGTAHVFFVRSFGSSPNVLRALNQSDLYDLRKGFDPGEAPPKPTLKGLDMFCGGGSFGRGLEEGGSVENKWAIDYDREAIHTYRANLKNVDDTKLYFGSVNDFLKKAIQGKYSDTIPKPGEVDFISAGSPCQGFSFANLHPTSEASMRNCSLVASVAAFIDFYRPKYAILENVLGMAVRGGNGKANVFAQMLCTLVALGYQARQSIVDAWSHGSPQSRSRLFIVVAAPGLPLPEIPTPSHSHPPNTPNRCLIRGFGSIEVGFRQFIPTPFKYVTAEEAFKDLPDIGDGHAQACIPFPDHRCLKHKSHNMRVEMQQIPRFPHGSTLAIGKHQGRVFDRYIHNIAISNYRKALNSKSWSRIFPKAIMPTVVTTLNSDCAFAGRTMHWDQPRQLTIQEARRAQSIPDHEVLIGKRTKQFKVVGNGVARTVALAFGKTLRDAWLNEDQDAMQAGRPIWDMSAFEDTMQDSVEPTTSTRSHHKRSKFDEKPAKRRKLKHSSSLGRRNAETSQDDVVDLDSTMDERIVDIDQSQERPLSPRILVPVAPSDSVAELPEPTMDHETTEAALVPIVPEASLEMDMETPIEPQDTRAVEVDQSSLFIESPAPESLFQDTLDTPAIFEKPSIPFELEVSASQW